MFKLKLLSISTIFIPAGCVSLAPEYQRPPAPVPQQFHCLKQSDACGKQLSGYGLAKLFVDPGQQADR